MSSASRQQNSTTAVEHVLEILLGEPLPNNRHEWGPFRCVFNSYGIIAIEDFMLLRPTDFFEGKYEAQVAEPNPDPDNDEPVLVYVDKHLTYIEIRTLESLQLLYKDQTYNNPVVNCARRWHLITRIMFSTWKGTYHPPAETAARIHEERNRPVPIIAGQANVAAAPAVITQQQRDEKELEEFIKKVKRDPKDYKAFKDDAHWTTWNRGLQATASTQRVERVIDLTLDPTTLAGATAELFKEQSTYMFKVFSDTLHTSHGRSCIAAYGTTQDGRKVYEKLASYYTSSRFAQLKITELEEKIRNLKLDKDWTGTATTFLNHWGDQVINLNLYKEPTDQTPTSVKLEWIKRAVKDHVALAAGINAHEANTHTMRGTFTNPLLHPELYDEDLQWAQILTRLNTIATEYDESFKKIKKAQRLVNTAGRGSGRGRDQTGGRSGRGGGTGRGADRNSGVKSGWIDPDEWKKMTPAQQQQTKDDNAAARLKAAREKKAQSERHIASLLQKAGQSVGIPTDVNVPTSMPITIDLHSLAGSAGNSTIATGQTGTNRLVNLLKNSSNPISINAASSNTGGTVSGNMVTDAAGNTVLQINLNMPSAIIV